TILSPHPDQAVLHLDLEDTDLALRVAGPHSALLREVAIHTGAQVSMRGTEIHIMGERAGADVAYRYLKDAAHLVSEGVDVHVGDVAHSVRGLRADPESSLVDLLDQVILVTPRRRPIAPKTAAQRKYIATIRKHDLTFGIGPAGTG